MTTIQRRDRLSLSQRLTLELTKQEDVKFAAPVQVE